MDLTTYREAQSIRAEIAKIEKKMESIKAYGKREKDAPFNDCRETAFEALDVLRLKWEKKFSEL